VEQLGYSLIAAAVAAITYVAYKHPVAFRKRFYPAMGFVTAIVGIGIASWDAALDAATSAIDSKLPLSTQMTADALIHARSVHGLVFFFAFMGYLCYCQFLYWLPDILGKEDAKKDE
jgi:hypothetical protein